MSIRAPNIMDMTPEQIAAELAAEQEVAIRLGYPVPEFLDMRPDYTGIHDGPYVKGCAPRKKPAAKPPEVMAEIRSRAWKTRREKYGKYGHDGAYRR